jgi:2-phospho-L-lactate transferase/gluconeogenesis factor (CofD/UPF0052 family)
MLLLAFAVAAGWRTADGAATNGPSAAPSDSSRLPGLTLFSGGTAMNSLAAALSDGISPRISHVLPVSDDGGSTAEIVRVLGGPALGDIRSRCLRLSDVSTAEARAVKRLLQHRLPQERGAAKRAWLPIVEGTDALWEHIEAPYRHTIRAFLVHFHAAVLSRAALDFDFSGGSIGNFLFAGLRLALHSLDAAIFVYCRVSNVQPETAILPSLLSDSERRVVLGARLADGRLIRGQNAISHPCGNGGAVTAAKAAGSVCDALSAPIHRVCYLSGDLDGSADSRPTSDEVVEVHPHLNPLVARALANSQAVIYGCGSLYTSICPSLIVRGVGEMIADLNDRVPKVLLLNGSPDRETRGMHAVDYVRAITTALNRDDSPPRDRRWWRRRHPSQNESLGIQRGLTYPPHAYVTVLFYPRGVDADIHVDRDELARLGVRVVEVPSRLDEDSGCWQYEPQGVVDALLEVLDAMKGE